MVNGEGAKVASESKNEDGKAGEYWEDDDEEDEDGNKVEGEGRMEIGEEEAEEGGRKKEEEIVEEVLQMAKAEQIEANSGGMVKKINDTKRGLC